MGALGEKGSGTDSIEHCLDLRGIDPCTSHKDGRERHHACNNYVQLELSDPSLVEGGCPSWGFGVFRTWSQCLKGFVWDSCNVGNVLYTFATVARKMKYVGKGILKPSLCVSKGILKPSLCASNVSKNRIYMSDNLEKLYRPTDNFLNQKFEHY